MKNYKLNSATKVGILVVLCATVFSTALLTGGTSRLLRTSIVGFPEHAPFDGTVYPVAKVPDWSHLSSDKYHSDYNSLSDVDLIDIPYYDPAQLATPSDSLVWGNADDNIIRNAKITYSVPYMGNYLLDGREYAGSHLAVDLKIPSGTPIFSIANGTVIKTSTQSSGFGHHIVVQHNNFPTLENPNAHETLYSSYSHLGDLLVSEGDVVTKGEQIAFSASTGTSTTPHIHFQLDNDEAPWHPFWPFTWQEASDAGLDFFGAVNAGLGQEIALQTTIHPLKYVQAYLDGDFSVELSSDAGVDADSGSDSDGSSAGVVADSYVPAAGAEDSGDEEVLQDEAEEVVVEEVVLEPSVLTFEFDVRSKYYLDGNSSFSLLLKDQYGNSFRDGLSGEITITSKGGLVTSSPAIANVLTFDSNGVLEGSFKRMAEGRDKLVVENNGVKYYSDWFEISAPSKEGISFSDLSGKDKYYEAISSLATDGVVNGYPDGTFRADSTVSRVEALKFIFEGIKESTEDGKIPFSDVSSNEWYGNYLFTAYKKGVVDGYPDGTFKPAYTVNRAEFYKMLFNGMNVEVAKNVSVAPFEDVGVDDWYAPYVAYAKELGIIDPSVEVLDPSGGMSRGEVAYAIWRLMELEY